MNFKKNIDLTVAKYYLWRILYIGIKPLSILAAAGLLGVAKANLLSIAILISTTLMASLSFGSYRYIFKYKVGRKKHHYERLRRALFLFNVCLIFLTTLILSILQIGNTTDMVFVALFVVTEHITHDESRVLLYAGNREAWARQNFFRSLYILLLPLLLMALGHDKMVGLIFIFFTFNVLVSIHVEGLCHKLLDTLPVLFSKRFYLFYVSQLNYFYSSTISKFSQQSDRYLFSILSYETLWVYTLVAQIASIALMYFEMTHVSELKSKIAKQKEQVFRLLTKKEIRDLIIMSAVCSLGYGVLSVFIDQLQNWLFVALFLISIAFNFIGALNLINSEKMFWHLASPRSFSLIEIKSFFIGHLLTVPLIFLLNATLLIKIPTLVSMAIKLRSAKACLKS